MADIRNRVAGYIAAAGFCGSLLLASSLSLAAGPEAASLALGQAQGRSNLFIVGRNKEIYQVSPVYGGFCDAVSVGVKGIEQVVVGESANGYEEVIGIGPGGAVVHAYQTSPEGRWGGMHKLGAENSRQLQVSRDASNRMVVFALGQDEKVYHAEQQAANGPFDAWSPLAPTEIGHVRQIAIGKNNDGRLEIFALGEDQCIYHTWQMKPNGGWARGWERLGTQNNFEQVLVSTDKQGRLEVFALAGDRTVYRTWYEGHATWEKWEPLVKHNIEHVIQLDIGRNLDGHLELFAVGADKTVYHSWESESKKGEFSEWEKMADSGVHQIAVGNDREGRLEVFSIGTEGEIFVQMQAHPGSHWEPRVRLNLR